MGAIKRKHTHSILNQYVPPAMTPYCLRHFLAAAVCTSLKISDVCSGTDDKRKHRVEENEDIAGIFFFSNLKTNGERNKPASFTY